MNKEGTGKGVAWVKSNFSSNRASTIIDRAEKFLDNMNFRTIGKGWSSDVEKEDGEVILNENLGYQKREWLASLYYIYLEYKIRFHRIFFPNILNVHENPIESNALFRWVRRCRCSEWQSNGCVCAISCQMAIVTISAVVLFFRMLLRLYPRRVSSTRNASQSAIYFLPYTLLVRGLRFAVA